MNRSSIGAAAAISALAFGAATLPGCGDGYSPAGQGRSPADSANSFNAAAMPTTAARLALVTGYGNMVYVFPMAFFPQTLSDFLTANPELRLVSFSQGMEVTSETGSYRFAHAENFVAAFEIKGDNASGQQTRPAERK